MKGVSVSKDIKVIKNGSSFSFYFSHIKFKWNCLWRGQNNTFFCFERWLGNAFLLKLEFRIFFFILKFEFWWQAGTLSKSHNFKLLTRSELSVRVHLIFPSVFLQIPSLVVKISPRGDNKRKTFDKIQPTLLHYRWVCGIPTCISLPAVFFLLFKFPKPLITEKTKKRNLGQLNATWKSY